MNRLVRGNLPVCIPHGRGDERDDSVAFCLLTNAECLPKLASSSPFSITSDTSSSSIDSALAQTYPNIEIVVVNDGSTDSSWKIIRGYGERVRAIDQANSGQVAALNRGYAASVGELILFLDADDVIEPDAIQRSVDVWTPGCAKVQFELEIIDGQSERLGRRFCNYPTPYGTQEVADDFRRFGTYAWPVLTGNLYARQYLDQIMPLTVTIAPDGIMNTFAPMYGQVAVVPDVLGYYRLHTANQNYHATTTDSIGLRFKKQIGIRTNEIDQLRSAAIVNGVSLPPANILDNEIVFVNYRLMLKKLAIEYQGAHNDSTFSLWLAGIRTLIARRTPFRAAAMHVVWLSVLFISPAALAQKMIAFRFNRSAFLQPLRRVLGRQTLKV